MSPGDRGFVDFVLDQLSDLESITTRSMFGGFGLYRSGAFFGIIYENRLYLKTDETTRGWYDSQGADSFRPNAKQHLKNYLEVPPDALEDREVLGQLVEEATALSAGK